MHLLLNADSRRIPLADGSVHCVVTSPPYWGLRDYATGRWEGGDEGCDHKVRPTHNVTSSTLDGGQSTNGHWQEGYRDRCGKCGARRVDRQLGLEATPDAFVATMVAVFREVKRVLRDDGTCWINLGDSYSSPCGPIGGHKGLAVAKERCDGRPRNPANEGRMNGEAGGRFSRDTGLKTKDLIGIPWRVALALQADGWWLRMDCIWAKPNPMPESVTDRPTKSHEYLFLMSKCEHYYYDADAVREEAESFGRKHASRVQPPKVRGYSDGTGQHQHRGDLSINYERSARNLRSVFRPEWDDDDWLDWIEAQLCGGGDLETLWDIPTESYRGAHFATYPRKLVEPCIRAGTSERGCCPRCGAGWVRVMERESWTDRPMSRPMGSRGNQPSLCCSIGQPQQGGRNVSTTTLGWQQDCSCPAADPVPAVVLDPFVGSGTTLVVAEALGRHGVGLDLSREYLGLAKHRIERPHARVPRPERADEVLPLFAGPEREPEPEAVAS